MEKTKKKEKPTPMRCVCGKEATVVAFKGKKMVSCPNPLKCAANLRTPWFSSEAEAVANWNTTIRTYKYAGRCKEWL
jgi:hypothetical protein